MRKQVLKKFIQKFAINSSLGEDSSLYTTYRVALTLGILSIIAAVTIGHFTYKSSFNAIERSLQELYLSQANAIVRGVSSEALPMI